MKDDEASHERLINLFKSIHSSFQRLENYSPIPLTEKLAELLGKIMAQFLSVLAHATKMMEDKGVSKLIDLHPLRALS